MQAAKPSQSLSRPIIESLYAEALVLADEVRMVFALEDQIGGLAGKGQNAEKPVRPAHGPTGKTGADRSGDMTQRLALSSEGLKATTRMMHVLAWLLNQRAYFSGELSETQVRLHGSLPHDRPSDKAHFELLSEDIRTLVEQTERLHGRIARLDAAWRRTGEASGPAASPALAFQRRIAREMGGG